MKLQAMRQIVCQTKLFGGLPEAEITGLFSKRYKKGEQVARFINNSQCIGVIATGCLHVYSIACDGSEININILGPGDVFGVCSIFLQHEIEALLKCSKNATVVYVPKDVFLNLMTYSPELLERYGILCSKKIQTLMKRIEILSIQSCRRKFVQYLFTCDMQDGIIKLPCSKEQFSKMMGISRAALFREFAHFQSQGIIAIEGSEIKIKDKMGLAQVLYQ